MFDNPHAKFYPAVVRVAGKPFTIFSDEDLFSLIRDTTGDDTHDLLKLRMCEVPSLPDKQSVLQAIERIQSDLSDAANGLDSLYSQMDNADW